jgi:hypothetical protein
MTSKTTMQKLQRLRDMKEAEVKGGTWWVNPKGHPEPTLPAQEYLEGEYLQRIADSTPCLVEKARELVSFAGRERRG